MITVQIESFRKGIDELRQVLPTHHRDLALFQDRMPLDPQYPNYFQREEIGGLVYAVARRLGKMVGYYIAFVAPGLHYQRTLTATMDIMYVLPDFRGAGIAIKLFMAVERELKRRGVQLWNTGSKIESKFHPSMDKLVRHFDFKPADIYYSKWIGD